MKYKAIKCPCGHEACQQWHITNVAQVQGVSFTEEQARLTAALLTSLDEPWVTMELPIEEPSAPGLIVTGTWACEERPGRHLSCEYNSEVDPCLDSCVHCGQPEERK